MQAECDPMTLAIQAAWQFQGCTFPNPAVGAVVVDQHGKILSVSAHEQAGGPHAEVFALQRAYLALTADKQISTFTTSHTIHDYLIKHHGGCFRKCTLYVTLEPCAHHGKTPSCATLIRALDVKKVVYAVADPTAEAAGGAALLQAAGIQVESVISSACETLLLPFVQWQKERLVTFKWAQRLDGTVDGGLVSCADSRRRVHAMRNAADLLIIGGNTVRTDRPTLDARLVDGRAPDVLILSRQTEFDRTIPLFGILDRKVMISHDLKAMQPYRNILIEGGPGMFETCKPLCDLFLCFVAPTSGGTIRFLDKPHQFTMKYLNQCGADVMQWMMNE